MTNDYPTTRRHYLGALGAAFLAPEVLAALQHAHRASQPGAQEKFTFFDAATAAEVEALAARIIPSEPDSPGAREAGIIYFIDHALATFDKEERKAYHDGLAAFQQKRKELFPSSSSIAALTAAEADALVRSMEKTPFFELLRGHTAAGFFGSPEWGGNRGEAGWKLIGFQDQHVFHSPFGWYDDPRNGGPTG
jgi:gluconate 2-dehydrogenase gamma chain